MRCVYKKDVYTNLCNSNFYIYMWYIVKPWWNIHKPTVFKTSPHGEFHPPSKKCKKTIFQTTRFWSHHRVALHTPLLKRLTISTSHSRPEKHGVGSRGYILTHIRHARSCWCCMLPHVCCMLLSHVSSCVLLWLNACHLCSCLLLPHVCCMLLSHVSSCVLLWLNACHLCSCLLLPHVCCMLLSHVCSCLLLPHACCMLLMLLQSCHVFLCLRLLLLNCHVSNCLLHGQWHLLLSCRSSCSNLLIYSCCSKTSCISSFRKCWFHAICLSCCFSCFFASSWSSDISIACSSSRAKIRAFSAANSSILRFFSAYFLRRLLPSSSLIRFRWRSCWNVIASWGSYVL